MFLLVFAQESFNPKKLPTKYPIMRYAFGYLGPEVGEIIFIAKWDTVVGTD